VACVLRVVTRLETTAAAGHRRRELQRASVLVLARSRRRATGLSGCRVRASVTESTAMSTRSTGSSRSGRSWSSRASSSRSSDQQAHPRRLVLDPPDKPDPVPGRSARHPGGRVG